MPNLRGGKAYKKGKKRPDVSAEEDSGSKFAERGVGQHYARVLRLFGNRRVLCFCNDGIERVCKIRGSLCHKSKKQIISVGDIVLVSLREFIDENSDSESDIIKEVPKVGGSDGVPRQTADGRKDIADILYRYEHAHWRQIKKEGGIHAHLFPYDRISNDISDMFEEETTDAGATTPQQSEEPEKEINVDEI